MKLIIELELRDEQVELMDRLRADLTGTHTSFPCSREDYIKAALLLRLIKGEVLGESARSLFPQP